MAKITREDVGKVFWWIKTVLGYVLLVASYLFTPLGILQIYGYIEKKKVADHVSDGITMGALLFTFFSLLIAVFLVLLRKKDKQSWFLLLLNVFIFVGFFFVN